MNFREDTLVHRVIIKPNIQKVSNGGIIIAKDERHQAMDSDRGIVHMIGPKAWKDFGCDDTPVKVGDLVYYSKYGAKVLKDEAKDELYIICNDEDILVGYKND